MAKQNLYASQDARLALAKQIAAESVVLLKNENHFLPLFDRTVAVLGRAAYRPNLGGMGSGMSFMGKEVPSITDACAAAGLSPEPSVDQFYREYFAAIPPENPFAKFQELAASGVDLVASGVIYDLFGQYSPQPEEIAVPEDLLRKAAGETDTALLVFGRSTGGEECDRHIVDDYELLDSERTLIDRVCGAFANVVLLVNTNGLTDLSWIDSYPSIRSVLFIGAGGEQGPAAVADLLTGKETPSGKLAFTIADSYDSYPTAKDFSFDKDHPENILEYKDYGLDAEANGSVGFEKSPVTVYRENLYIGYRYFDSFGKDVLWPFGFGLSYADFAVSDVQASLIAAEDGTGSVVVSEGKSAPAAAAEDAPCLRITASVSNLSDRWAGKEVLQLYVSSPEGNLEQPYQAYKTCVKTPLISPGETASVAMELSVRDLASYDEARAAWLLESGDYLLRVGVSSRDTHVAAKIHVPETILCRQVRNCLSLRECNRDKIDFLSAKGVSPISYAGEAEEIEHAPVLTLRQEDVRILTEAQKVPEVSPAVFGKAVSPENSPAASGKAASPEDLSSGKTLKDVAAGTLTMKEFLSGFSDEELMALAVGYGPGLPMAGLFGSKDPSTIQDADGNDVTVNTHPTGNAGYISPAIPKRGIPSAFYKDGPASCGKIAWPTGMTLSCSFSKDLCYAFGSACAKEAEEQQVDSWLAPALNLHRNPIGGRNFEYFSEDPYVAGICGAYICRGAAETTSVTCCPKHFALNEQETYRRGSIRKSYDAADSIATERTARELYLKPFEIVLREAPVRNIMTSFNKINGTFAGGSSDLCTEILRNEFGFRGVVVTDWGDMDIVVDGADAVAAGNDVVMPGGPPVIAQIQKGFTEGRLSRAQLETAVGNLLYFVMRSGSFAAYHASEEA